MTLSPVDVSAVVVNYRSAELTLRALRDLETSAGGAVRVQEIVVDNASGEADALRAARPGATVIAADRNGGFAAGNNLGIATADGRHLLLVNPDAFAIGDALPRLVAHLDAEPAAGVAAPLLVWPDGSPQDNVFRRFPNLLTLFVDYCAPLAFAIRGTRWDPHNVDRASLVHARPVAHAIGAVLLVRREAAEAAGPLDEGFFMFFEETEWQRRIAAAGWRIDVVPDAVFTHVGGGSSAGSPLASPAYLDSLVRFHPRPRAALAVVRVAGLISLVTLRAALALRLGSPKLRGLHAAFADLRRELRGR